MVGFLRFNQVGKGNSDDGNYGGKNGGVHRPYAVKGDGDER
jgi:hypothetical protein